MVTALGLDQALADVVEEELCSSSAWVNPLVKRR
jgi:hypothetical protein